MPSGEGSKPADAVVTLTPAEARRWGRLTAEDEARLDAMTDHDIARQIAEDPDVAPDLSAPLVRRRFSPVVDPDVQRIRKRLRLSQTAFAERFGFPVATLRQWEQGRRRPSGASLTLLRLLEADPEGIERIREIAKS